MAGPGECVPAGTRWGGGGVSRLLEGSRGGKVDGFGSRGFGSRGCRAAIVVNIHGFLTIGGGVG